MKDFTQDELKRYSRHISLPPIGSEGQKKLKAARVLCVGVGGLGSPCVLYLAASGVGTIGIIDSDKVALSDLNRQILYTDLDQGKLKVEVAKERLEALNPHIKIETYSESFSLENALSIIKKYDVVIDSSDNFSTRLLVNDTCVYSNMPNVSASVFQFEGQLSVFNGNGGPCYRCLYPEASQSNVQNCEEGGVLGVLPGVMGLLQATEVIKLILGVGDSLVGQLLTFNALTMQFQEFHFNKNTRCDLCNKKIDFDLISSTENIIEISPEKFQELHNSETDFILLDVREPLEYEESNLGGKLIPLGELPERVNELNQEKLIIVHCKSGRRSRKAVKLLLEKGFNAQNLQGGIMAVKKRL